MAGNTPKSNKAQTVRDRRQAEAPAVRNPSLTTGVAFFIGVLLAASLFALTPLGEYCFSTYRLTPVYADRGKGKAPGSTGSRKLAAGSASELDQRLKRASAATPGQSPKADKSDPLAELNRVRQINERNRRLMAAAAAGGRPQPANPPAPHAPRPVIPGAIPTPPRPVVPAGLPAPVVPRQPTGPH